MKLNASGLEFSKRNFRPWVWLAFPVGIALVSAVLAFLALFVLAIGLVAWPVSAFIKWEVSNED